MNIFLFHRDIRVEDNLGLLNLVEETNGENIFLFFIYNKKQLYEKNEYFSQKAFDFLNNALINLSKKVNINLFYAENEIEVFEEILQANKIERIYINKDWSDFALARDKDLKQFCQKNNIIFKEFNDYLLFRPGDILNNSNSFYKVFTPFYNNCVSKLVENLPTVKKTLHFYTQIYKNSKSCSFLQEFKYFQTFFPNSIDQILEILKNNIHDYAKNRNNLAIDSNKISPAIRFGIISIRQLLLYVYQETKNINHELIRQLIWREFYYHFNFLASQTNWNFGNPWNRKFYFLEYNQADEKLKLWKEGKTGFPLIDAAIQELLQTGFMHNRARMVVASFLTKNLFIDWHEGEKFFAQHLIDYDPIINHHSWQWVAGCGVDAQLFTRIFNPILQQKKFDSNNYYISKFLPTNYQTKPIVDLHETSNKIKKVFQDNHID
ncbi:Deoxyribodipyrimidine photo-lyase [Mesomycoplasma conjunctivae]|uniref:HYPOTHETICAL Deoxyribodipyrimidine photo-lyase n=1 Tax=Mesomycoplasma conjunctivae (strain ATCC 25834 / NCTC 10147 / HRC/581) TaxID=572263 RepID=C5J747_MESCH|nr:deoxyribodipyrimidine photo-lyase [Mesomycoplasma conjunctivae]CAT05310.1 HYPOTHETICAL Deoxyribodipyrimidine photo-lyase [Mesomycoplasma conjunctivae]VEU66539.1 Deoxyribodipyrimidine photo-lyase [Mesomycoplasma conjunctivae]